ncbi:uncharacterized protein LOC130999092 [Salvia miltiorrhiza]|uniref:uncharacterized protein LOC130999092 n=1 Tax=Salvia miltiorrhiza TaxID=226208 RepID=UPI0025AD524C|nr:uncharacterized protein LOC130999092 [Salvia miltiorrhiza]
MESPTAKFHHHRHLLLLFLLLIAAGKFKFADAAQRKIHITDELDDVVDDEEDDDWRQWGAAKRPDFDPPPPTDFTKMGEMREENMMGPVFGFVKLRPGTRRTSEMVSEMAMKWTKVARTGATEARFSAVDLSTVMFTMPKGRNVLELKEYLLSQPEAYEIKIGDQLFRRPGDPTFDEVFHKLQMEKAKSSDANTMNDERHHEL